MANTNILIKRSYTTGRPGQLAAGEFAYSYASNTLFLGTPDGNGVINVGGHYYTSTIDASTDLATGSTLVKRDATGNASFNYILANVVGTIAGNADSATRLQTPRNFSTSSADILSDTFSFDGTDNVVMNANLTFTGVDAGTYGGVTKIPVITVDDKGRLSYAANVDVATTLNFQGDSGTGSMEILTDTLTITGGDGVTTSVDDANNAVVVEVDNTVIRTNGVPAQTINSDLYIVGNVSISGNTFYHDVSTLNIADPLIYLAANNYTSDIVDIGFTGNYFDGTTQRHTGFIRKHGTNEMYAFTNYDEEFDGNVLNIANPSLVLANLHASLTGGMVYGLANTINVGDGGTGQSSFNHGSILIGNGNGALQVLANSTYVQTGGFATNNTITAVQVDAYGRLTDVNVEAISGLTVGQGGTGSSSFNGGEIVIANPTGTALVQLANVASINTTITSNSTVSNLTTDTYGRVTGYTTQAIGGLTVGQGGTGTSTFTTNGIIFGNDAGALQVTSAAGVADQGWSNQILTTTNAGVPVWSTALDGGTF